MNVGQLSTKIVKGKIAGRLCAICNKRTGEHTYGFRGTLSANGIAGDKAHVRCVQTLKDAKMKRDTGVLGVQTTPSHPPSRCAQNTEVPHE